MGFGSNYLRTMRVAGLAAILSTCVSAQLLNRAQTTEQTQPTKNIFSDSDQPLPPIFAPRDANSPDFPVHYRLTNKGNNVTTQTFSEAVKQSAATNSSRNMALTIEPVTPQFDTPSQAYRNAAAKLLPYSSFVAVSISKPFENLNGDDHKAYKWDFSIRGSGIVLKTQYKSEILNGLLIEGSVNDRQDVQVRIPLKQFYLPFLPRSAQVSGGINYDINNRKPELNKRPSISIFSRW